MEILTILKILIIIAIFGLLIGLLIGSIIFSNKIYTEVEENDIISPTSGKIIFGFSIFILTLFVIVILMHLFYRFKDWDIGLTMKFFTVIVLFLVVAIFIVDIAVSRKIGIEGEETDAITPTSANVFFGFCIGGLALTVVILLYYYYKYIVVYIVEDKSFLELSKDGDDIKDVNILLKNIWGKFKRQNKSTTEGIESSQI